LEGLAKEDVGIFYGHLVYFTAIRNILRTYGIFYGHIIYFVAIWYIFPVLVCCTKKNLATLYVPEEEDMKVSISPPHSYARPVVG
jgi:hypothetical protein